MIICAGRNETFDFATPIGVGLIESTMNLTKICLHEKPESLLFIGSAGSYGDYKIFDIVHSQSASNIEIGFLEKKCYSPLECEINLEKDLDVPRETLNVINCSNYITTDPVSSEKFRSFGLALENMEFFALLNVAKEYGIPILGIFVVTNYCNANAHKDFIKNHKEAKELLTEYIKENK